MCRKETKNKCCINEKLVANHSCVCVCVFVWQIKVNLKKRLFGQAKVGANLNWRN